MFKSFSVALVTFAASANAWGMSGRNDYKINNNGLGFDFGGLTDMGSGRIDSMGGSSQRISGL